jgi:hypothetical protein
LARAPLLLFWPKVLRQVSQGDLSAAGVFRVLRDELGGLYAQGVVFAARLRPKQS